MQKGTEMQDLVFVIGTIVIFLVIGAFGRVLARL